MFEQLTDHVQREKYPIIGYFNSATYHLIIIRKPEKTRIKDLDDFQTVDTNKTTLPEQLIAVPRCILEIKNSEDVIGKLLVITQTRHFCVPTIEEKEPEPKK